jgi:hypothetical protein
MNNKEPVNNNGNFTTHIVTYQKQPHSCPVCGGRGIVPWDFYETRADYSLSVINGVDVMCRSRGGTGIVWEVGR